MAFGFLRDALGLAGAAGSVAALFGMGGGGADRQARQIANRQIALSEALADPNSPMFAQARQQAMEQSRTAQAQMLRDLLGQQARQARRFQAGGGTAFYARNPRRDEEISRQLMMMGQNEQARADQAARQQLMGSMQGFGSAAQAAQMAQQQRLMRTQGILGGLFGAGESIARAQKLYEPTQQQSPVQGAVTESVSFPQRPTSSRRFLDNAFMGSRT